MINQFFANINGTIYVRKDAFVKAGWSPKTFTDNNDRSKKKFNPYWQVIRDPADARRPLVQYDTLRPAHKAKLNAHFTPDVPTWYAKAPIKALVVKDVEAERYYTDYRLPDGRALAPEKIAQYTAAASWLTMLVKYGTDTRFVRKELGIASKEVFWQHCVDIIKAEGTKLPHNVRKLLIKVKQYSQDAKPARYQRLVHGNHGNDNRLKVIDATAQRQLLDLIAHPNQYDDVLVMMLYNEWANAQGYEPIGAATVGVWRRKKDMEATAGRLGNAALNEKYLPQVKGVRPSAPLYLVECDDYYHNYRSQDSTLPVAKGRHHQYYVSYMVVDSYNDLVLGKCYRHTVSPNVDMVRLAWIDAMYYIRDLVGDGNWYAPWEVKADGFASSNLHPWLSSIANFVPAGHGNKHRGYIEQAFGSDHLQRCEKLAAHEELNYSGHNTTARTRGVNMEVYNREKSRRPQIGEESVEQLERFYYLLRHMPAFTRKNTNAPSKEQQWLQAFRNLPAEDRRPLSDEQMLLMFGIRHTPSTGTIRITNRGVEPQIEGVKYSFHFTQDWAHLIGKDVTVVYDPYDMNRALVTNDKDIRCIVHNSAPELMARALRDAQPGHRAALNAILLDKTQLAARASANLSTGTPGIADPKAVLLGHTMPKHIAANIAKDYIDAEAMQATEPATPRPDRLLQERMQHLNNTIDLLTEYED